MVLKNEDFTILHSNYIHSIVSSLLLWFSTAAEEDWFQTCSKNHKKTPADLKTLLKHNEEKWC